MVGARGQGIITKFWSDCSHCSFLVSPALGKSGMGNVPLTPRKNASPKVVTRTVVLANSTPSISAWTV